MIRAPYAVTRRVAKPQGDFYGGLEQFVAMAKEVMAAREEIKKLHGEIVGHLAGIKEGPPGRPGTPGQPGKDAEPLNHDKVVADLVKRIRVRVPKDGKPGLAGKTIDPQMVVPLVVEHLKKTKAITTEHIGNFTDGLEQTIRPIRSLVAGFRGGGDTVSAGTNVTITNVGGAKVINASGGFSALAATETPDGARTTFTFPAATAQPSYLIADNTIIRATTKKGTVNWTWNNGTKVATLTIPPQDEIQAIV